MPLPNHSTRKRPGRRQWFTRRNRVANRKGSQPSGCKGLTSWQLLKAQKAKQEASE